MKLTKVRVENFRCVEDSNEFTVDQVTCLVGKNEAGKTRQYQAGDRIRSLYHSFKSAAERAKLPAELVQHDPRHRRVTTWLAEGKKPCT